MNKKKSWPKTCLTMLGVMVALFCGIALWFWNSIYFLEARSLDVLEKNLYSSDVNIMRESLSLMRRRGATNEIARAIELLAHEDDYVWLTAARYLGSNGEPVAIPYLIKSLRHTAGRGDEETLHYLRSITGIDNGANFTPWYSWWIESNSDEEFDWSSRLGPYPRMK